MMRHAQAADLPCTQALRVDIMPGMALLSSSLMRVATIGATLQQLMLDGLARCRMPALLACSGGAAQPGDTSGVKLLHTMTAAAVPMPHSWHAVRSQKNVASRSHRLNQLSACPCRMLLATTAAAVHNRVALAKLAM